MKANIIFKILELAYVGYTHLSFYGCLYVYMSACMYVCMYVCTYVYVCMYVNYVHTTPTIIFKIPLFHKLFLNVNIYLYFSFLIVNRRWLHYYILVYG